MDTQWSLPIRRVPEYSKKDTSIVWNNVHVSYEQKLFGQVTCMRYNNSGSILGCSATNQLALLRVPQSEGVVVNEQSERKTYSVYFRDDDKLMVQSIEQRVVVKSPETAFRRDFQGHTRDVRSSIFLGKHNFVSASDDTTVRLWDLLSDGEIAVGSAHTDYVRCLENYTSGSFFSGSYDHAIHLWDPRASLAAPLQSSGDTLKDAVEGFCYIPSMEILACGSGDQTILFDVRKGLKQPLFQGSFHTKAVVSLAYSAEHQTLLTGSLDGRVKMFTIDGSGLACLATKKFDDAVTAVAVHPNSKEFAVGSATGEMKVFKFREIAPPAEPSPLMLEERKPRDVLQEKLASVEYQLRTYQYSKSLKTALYSRHADVIVSTLEELLRRGALHVALSNQNDRTVVRVLRFASSYVDKSQFTDTMLTVLETIFEIYGAAVGRSNFFHREMINAQKRIGAALAVLQRMERTMAIMELIVNADGDAPSA